MKIKDLPIEYRPREKALKTGIDSLSNEELLAIVLGSGNKSMNVVEVATSVLSTTGGIKGLLTYPFAMLNKIKGLSTAKSLTLMAIGELYKRVDTSANYKEEILGFEKYQKLVSFDSQEKLYLIIFNKLGKVLEEKELYKGSSTGIHITIRDIVKEILLRNGYSFYLIHTHPNSISIPSEDDIKATKALRKRCQGVGIKMLDHFIISPHDISSVNNYL